MEIINARYELIDVLGEGGVGRTYKARDLQTEELIAVKVISFKDITDWKTLDLFKREAKILQQLNFSGIPHYLDSFDIEEEGDRLFCLVQELAPGKTLTEWIQQGWRPNEAEAQDIAKQLLEILIYLQNLTPAVIHRDIKPQNILRDPQGKINLVDFGAVQDTYRQTMSGGSTVVGTFGYMAPEQFRGQASLATDLYGLGATILYLLTEKDPIHLQSAESLALAIPKELGISQHFWQWLSDLLEPAVEDRCPSAEAAMLYFQNKETRSTQQNYTYIRPKNTSIHLLKTEDYLRVSFLPRNFRHFPIMKMAIKLIISFLCTLLCLIVLNYAVNGTIQPAYVNPFQIIFFFIILSVSSYFTGRYILMLSRPTIFTLNTQFLNLKGYLKPFSPYQDVIVEFDRIREIRLKQHGTISRCVIRTVDQEEFSFGDFLSLAEQRWLIFEIQEFMKEVKARVSQERQANLELMKDRSQNGLDLLLNQGIDKYRWQKIEEAKALFNAAALLDNGCAEAFNNLGIVACQQKKYTEAVRAFKKSLQLIPGYWAARMNLSIAYKKLGNHHLFSESCAIRPVFGSQDGIARYTLVLRDASSGVCADILSAFIEADLMNQGNISKWQREFALRHLQRVDEPTSNTESLRPAKQSNIKESKAFQQVSVDPRSQPESPPKWVKDVKISALHSNSSCQKSPKPPVSSKMTATNNKGNYQQVTVTYSRFPKIFNRFDRIMTTKRGLFLVPIVCLFLTIKILPTVYIWGWILLPLGGMIYRTVRLKGNKFKIFGSSFLVALLSFILPRSFIAEARYTVGSVMEPTLPNQSRFVVDKTSYITTNPNRGDIIIFKMAKIYSPDSRVSLDYQGSSQEVKVSRIIGLPGETVEIRNGYLFINGRKQRQSYFSDVQSNILAQYNLNPFKVPNNFVLYKDDFRSNGQSATGGTPPLGLIPRDSIVGKATAVFYPFEKSKRL